MYIGKVLTGYEFKFIFGTEFYKILNNNLKHHDLIYVDGINMCLQKFIPTEKCLPGCLCFTILKYIYMYINHKSTYVVKIEILDDSKIYIEKNKFKTDKFQIDLSKKCLSSELKKWLDTEF